MYGIILSTQSGDQGFWQGFAHILVFKPVSSLMMRRLRQIFVLDTPRSMNVQLLRHSQFLTAWKRLYESFRIFFASGVFLSIRERTSIF
jgi:hypothetical protein